MSLKGRGGVWGPFFGCEYRHRRRGCGNVGIAKRFPRAVGREEDLCLVILAFHRPAIPQPHFHALRLAGCSSANRMRLASCMRRADSVSDSARALSFSASKLWPGLRSRPALGSLLKTSQGQTEARLSPLSHPLGRVLQTTQRWSRPQTRTKLARAETQSSHRIRHGVRSPHAGGQTHPVRRATTG